LEHRSRHKSKFKYYAPSYFKFHRFFNFAIDNYISKLANIAKIDTKIERLALEIAQKTNNNFFSDGKAPNGLAAAYIYLASVQLGINLLQIDVSNFAGGTEVTIRNRCKDILNNFKLVVNAKPAN
jgi:transcription initiation factor TFIIB